MPSAAGRRCTNQGEISALTAAAPSVTQPMPENRAAAYSCQGCAAVAQPPTPSASSPPSYEYQVPSGMATGSSYGFTLAPTATPTPSPPPLDVSVEED